MIFDDNKGRFLAIVLSVFVLIAICIAAFIYHNEKFNFHNISMLKQKKDKDGSNYIKCQLFSNLGNQNYLMLEMAIPYENKTQHTDLKQKMDRIKSDMLTNIDQEEMNKWVKERNYVAIKSELLKVINKHTKKPIEHIYFESFLYQ
jgi:flagellar basal body-associated protein FliL